MSARRPVLLAVAAVVGAWSLWIVTAGEDDSTVVSAAERAPRAAVRPNEISPTSGRATRHRQGHDRRPGAGHPR